MKVDLNKVERVAPELLSLVKTSQLNLDKRELLDHTARVALMLDVSGCMEDLFRSGKVNELVKRAIPLALQFDDDGQVDVFCFSNEAHEVGEYGLENYKDCVPDIIRNVGLSGGTYYAEALELVSRHYRGTELPVYLMFVTDGDTSEKRAVEEMMRKMSRERIFIQYIGLGENYFPERDDSPAPASAKSKKGLLGRLLGLLGGDDDVQEPSNYSRRHMTNGFQFLANLDELEGRLVDNANFFAIKHPTSISDDKLYGLLLNEYPDWLKAARAAKILK